MFPRYLRANHLRLPTEALVSSRLSGRRLMILSHDPRSANHRTMMGRGSEHRARGFQEDVDLGIGADADPEALGQTWVAHQPDQDLAVLERMVDLAGGGPAGEPEEVGLALGDVVFQRPDGLDHPAAGREDPGSRLGEIVLVLERGRAADEAQGV